MRREDGVRLGMVGVRVPYSATFSWRGTSTRSRHLLSDELLVAVPTIGSSDAPVVLRALVSEVDEGNEVEWRDWNGGYWRPIVDGRRPLAMSLEEFAASSPWEGSWAWIDSPFGQHFAESLFGVLNPIPPHLATLGIHRGKLREHERELAFAEAARAAAEALVEIDGVIHRWSPPPMWSLEPADWNRTRLDGIRLVLPDRSVNGYPSALFPLDRLEAALEAAEREGRCLEAPSSQPVDVPPLRASACEAAAIYTASYAVRQVLPRNATAETAAACARMVEAVRRIERPGIDHPDDDLEEAERRLHHLARQEGMDEGAASISRLLIASRDCYRRLNFDPDDEAALSFV